jgi:hypothetical protein
MTVEDRVEEYRRRACEAREKAARMTTTVAREGLLQLADGWNEMAERILKNNGHPK